MRKKYSDALRAQVVQEVAAGATLKAAAKKHGVSFSAAAEWYHAAEKTQNLRKLEQGPGPAWSKPVRCVETGAVYASITAAAKAAYVDKTCISLVARGRQNRAGGYRWEFVDKNDKR